jgi:CBS domain-containing protein
MKPVSELHMVTPDTPVTQALEAITRDDVNQLPVVAEGRLQGILSRSSVMGFLRNRADLMRR